MLQIRKISKEFGRTRALDAVSFDLAPRRITGLVGANGAGKSTLFRILAGLMQPDTGNALLNGVSLIDFPDRLAGRIGYLPDHPAADKFTTVNDLLDTTARLHGLTGDCLRAAMAEQLELTGIGDWRNKRLTDLSCGQLQRVALARLLIGAPDILLLDEPASGLDPRSRLDLYRILKQLPSRGQSILISSHILSELDEICDDIVILDRGRVIRSESLTGNPALPQLTLTFDGPAEPFRAAIAAMAQVVKTEISGSRMQITVSEADAVPSFLEQCFHERLPIASVQRNTHRIADLYLNATEEKS